MDQNRDSETRLFDKRLQVFGPDGVVEGELGVRESESVTIRQTRTIKMETSWMIMLRLVPIGRKMTKKVLKQKARMSQTHIPLVNLQAAPPWRL